ncbi:protein kinase domain-containing protein [Aspergillus foveolatus]|uniref:protein kinase domain-containing protein n=1 Tax=Aspergillus foveolatus TaxID=210207 RepID=UPI003CCCBBED
MDMFLNYLTQDVYLCFYLLGATSRLVFPPRPADHVRHLADHPSNDRPSHFTLHSEESIGSRADGALQSLQEGLKAYRLTASIEAPRKFIPRSHLQRLVRENVQEILREQSIVDNKRIPLFGQLISEEATQLFAILVDVKKEQHIIDFLEEGIRDRNLPFVRASKLRRLVQTINDWDWQSIENLESKQYRVLSPVFRSGAHYELDYLHILPFIEQETEARYKRVAAGGYGEVSREYIHPDHHEFQTSPARDGLVVAVKCMFHKANFELEKKVYLDLGPTRHPHLIELLFTFQKRDKYHLVFPWADGNLRDYWEKYPFPKLTRGLVLWSLEQLAGIASGLACFHEFTNPAHGHTRFGRHGDIKAQNILWFHAENVLKIADLGVANVRGRDSRSNIPASTVAVSPTYSPPDIQRQQHISRKWDIWSLGCLYLEYITYLVLGWPAILTFSSLRREPSSQYPELFTDEFYATDYRSVKPSVNDWVAQLQQNSRCSSVLHDLLNLIMTEMINEEYVLKPKLKAQNLPSSAVRLHLVHFGSMQASRPLVSQNLLPGPQKRSTWHP